MIILVVGGMNSGKSKYAEDIIRTRFSDLRGYYIATMIPYGEFGQEKIAKHKAMREDIGLETIEDPYLEHLDEIYELDKELVNRLTDDSLNKKVILMEDLSNLIANYMFERKSDYKPVFNKLLELGEKNELIIVALRMDEKDESQGYDAATIAYIKEMNKEIELISDIADEVVYMNNLE